MRKILTDVVSQRHSKRYKGYLRISHDDYNLALVRLLERDGADLIERHRLEPRLASLKARLSGEQPTALAKLLTGIGQELPRRKKPMEANAEEFNGSMERYYRTTLKSEQLDEALSLVGEDCQRLKQQGDPLLARIVGELGEPGSSFDYLQRHRPAILAETATPEQLRAMIRLVLAVIHHHRNHQ